MSAEYRLVIGQGRQPATYVEFTSAPMTLPLFRAAQRRIQRTQDILADPFRIVRGEISVKGEWRPVDTGTLDPKGEYNPSHIVAYEDAIQRYIKRHEAEASVRLDGETFSVDEPRGEVARIMVAGLQVACPTCSAEPGERCKDMDDKRVHLARAVIRES